MVATGGMLVFAVCTLEREESEEQVEAFLKSHPDFSRLPLTGKELFGHDEWITPAGAACAPCHVTWSSDKRHGRALCCAPHRDG